MATGLSVLEASRWCDVSTREAARMMKLAFGEPGSPGTVGAILESLKRLLQRTTGTGH